MVKFLLIFIITLWLEIFVSSLQLYMKASLMKFGNKFDLKLDLPIKDKQIAAKFFQNPSYVVENIWDAKKLTKLSNDNKYALRFEAIPIPGMDAVAPQIEVKFTANNGRISMVSERWELGGTSNILKDSDFMKTFDIKLYGEIQLSIPSKKDQNLQATGYVDYRVQGERPAVFNLAPPMLLETVIKFIENRVSTFVMEEFSKKMLKSFRIFYLTELQKQSVSGSK